MHVFRQYEEHTGNQQGAPETGNSLSLGVKMAEARWSWSVIIQLLKTVKNIIFAAVSAGCQLEMEFVSELVAVFQTVSSGEMKLCLCMCSFDLSEKVASHFSNSIFLTELRDNCAELTAAFVL